jgi:hypothetical protein
MKTMVLGVALTVGFAALAIEDAIAHGGGGGIDLAASFQKRVRRSFH